MTIAERWKKEGVEKGRLETVMETAIIIIKQTERRFGHVSPTLEKKLKQSNMDLLGKFGVSILDFKDIEDAEKWWDDQNFGSA